MFQFTDFFQAKHNQHSAFMSRSLITILPFLCPLSYTRFFPAYRFQSKMRQPSPQISSVYRNIWIRFHIKALQNYIGNERGRAYTENTETV